MATKVPFAEITKSISLVPRPSPNACNTASGNEAND